MAYSPLSTSPLILYPARSLQPNNWQHATAWAGSDWAAEVTGASTAARDTTFGYSNTNSGKLTMVAGASSGAISRVTTFTNIKLYEPDGYYFYTWIYCTSADADSIVRLQVNAYSDAGITSIYSGSTDYGLGYSYGAGTVTVGAWNLIRHGPFTDSLETIARLDLRVIVTSTAGTPAAVVNFDDSYFGHAVDFQDLGPLTDGASLAHPYSAPKTVPTTSARIPNGNHQSVRYNLGWSVGKMTSSIIDTDAKAIIDTFQDYCTDATAFTLWHSRTDETRDYYAEAIIPGGVVKDGFKQAAIYWTWEQSFEVPL